MKEKVQKLQLNVAAADDDDDAEMVCKLTVFNLPVITLLDYCRLNSAIQSIRLFISCAPLFPLLVTVEPR